MRKLVLLALLTGCYFETPTHPNPDASADDGDDASEIMSPVEGADGGGLVPNPDGGAPCCMDASVVAVVPDSSAISPSDSAAPAVDSGSLCTSCDAGPPPCGTPGRPCPACSSDTACPSSDRAKCDLATQQCVQCDSNAQCLHLGGPGVCASGRCVECTTAEAGKCTAASKVCDPASNSCVQCLGDAQCSAADKAKCDPTLHQCVVCDTNAQCAHLPGGLGVCSAGRCVECTTADASKCTTAGKVCKTVGNVCVACNDDNQCPTAANAKCNLSTNLCTVCDSNTQCAHVQVGANSDLDICNSGTCVQCTPATETTECGVNACDPTTFGCTSTRRNSLATCGACRSDSECFSDHKCIRVPFKTTEGTYHCMRQVPTNGCPSPYGSPAIVAASRNGVPSASYCGHSTNVTSCAAIVALSAGTACTTANASTACGPGARCQTVNTNPNRCTFSCSADFECLGSAPCNEQSSADPYCGGPAM